MKNFSAFVSKLNTAYLFMGVCVLLLLHSHKVVAQIVLPHFVRTTGTVLSNTNGSWVTVNPAQPNNIDLVETRIFEMPKRGSGVMAVDFQLVGADGGTARFQAGFINNFAHGGGGAKLNYTINLNNKYGRPFMVTFGKKGESATFGQDNYCSSGGGGSTGMVWLYSNAQVNRMRIAEHSVLSLPTEFGYLIAAAGGGGGGFATDDNTISHGASANVLIPSSSSGGSLDQSAFKYKTDTVLGAGTAYLPAGGSVFYYDYYSLNPPTCCSIEKLFSKTSSIAYNTFDYTTGVVLGSAGNVLQSLTLGQGGGKPAAFISAISQLPGTISPMSVESITKLGGRGGAGFSGGGAGVSNSSLRQLASISALYNALSTSGGGGTGVYLYYSMP